MDTGLGWTVFVAVISAVWALLVLARDRVTQALDRSSALIARLIDYDKLNIENPEIQRYLSQHASRDVAYFREPVRLDESLFFQAKTLAYKELNLFDEILSAASTYRRGPAFLRPAPLIELADWEQYIKEKLRHPLCRSILIHEGHIFGSSLRGFWQTNRAQIEARAPDPFIW